MKLSFHSRAQLIAVGFCAFLFRDAAAQNQPSYTQLSPTVKAVLYIRPPGDRAQDKKYGLPRVEDLRSAPAAIRFLSIEPLLEELGGFDLSGIDWVIVGGESGPGARPMKQQWVRSILDQCNAAKVPFFFRQWGGVNKRKPGRILNGRTFDEMPQHTMLR